MKTKIVLDLVGGTIYETAQVGLMDGDSLTVYGIRYRVGSETDNTGAILAPIESDPIVYPGHTTIQDLRDKCGAENILANLEPQSMTVAEYRALAPDCSGDLLDAQDEVLPEDAVITVFADNTYCPGVYDGGQTCETLI